MTATTQEEDEQYLKEVISEIKVKRKVGRRTKFTAEELLERKRAGDRRRYYQDPAKRMLKLWRVGGKTRTIIINVFNYYF